ncbi:hypothetical protein BC830DRAFT_240885 [Chytriomyces sp. MP71]|nr:hypothetical protein BC830DRAFT_240885 [Chytriomyces sp. MP71]
MKIRVQVGTDMLQIPCSTVGTPKTVRWLQNEVARRYKQMHKKSIQVEKLMVQDDRNSREKTLFKDDLVIHVLEGRENVKAIFS